MPTQSVQNGNQISLLGRYGCCKVDWGAQNAAVNRRLWTFSCVSQLSTGSIRMLLAYFIRCPSPLQADRMLWHLTPTPESWGRGPMAQLQIVANGPRQGPFGTIEDPPDQAQSSAPLVWICNPDRAGARMLCSTPTVSLSGRRWAVSMDNATTLLGYRRKTVIRASQPLASALTGPCGSLYNQSRSVDWVPLTHVGVRRADLRFTNSYFDHEGRLRQS
jgi:hypothetical protein